MQDRAGKPTQSRYEGDFFAWCEEQARVLRARQLDQIDVDNIAEEIESLGLAIKREIKNRAQTLNTLLLRWRQQPELRGRGWLSTLERQREVIRELIEECPSLEDFARDAIAATYDDARSDADLEAGPLGFPEIPPYSPEQALTPEFLPTDLDRPMA